MQKNKGHILGCRLYIYQCFPYETCLIAMHV